MSSAPDPVEAKPAQPPAAVSRGYANYVLFVLVLVYVFNFIDRQILSILAEDIKADLGLSDASLGFLYGTAFAVFYAIFGIPLSRLADIWTRKSLISIGLFFWSTMTALSGTARNFASLAAFRIGVGVGESSASPAAFSMLGDYFPPRLRATAVAIYSSGVYIGAGIGIFMGGVVVDGWNRAYPPESGTAPFGLAGWQAAFFVVGLPGLLMALWVWTLREPIRGMSEGILQRGSHPHPFRAAFRETAAVLPPFTLWSLWQSGLGAKGLVTNLAIAGACALGAWGLISALGSAPQWIALAIGLYAFFSWLQGLKRRDGAAYSMIYGSRAVVLGMIGFAWIAFVGYGIGFWVPPFFQRMHGVSAAQAGTVLGLSAAIGGWLGVTAGGIFSDWLRRRTPRARPYVGIITALIASPAIVMLVTTRDLTTAYICNFLFQLLSSTWIGSAVALSNELVLPRMRATASAYYLLAVTFIGLALGPYSMGQVSDRLTRAGTAPPDALARAMLISLVAYAIGIVFLFFTSRFVQGEEASRLERAKALGEAVS